MSYSYAGNARRRAAPGVVQTSDLGTPQQLGQALADVAPNSVLLDVFTYKDAKGQVRHILSPHTVTASRASIQTNKQRAAHEAP